MFKGYDVRVKFVNRTVTFKNVTEIHYRHAPDHKSVAFESGIHSTGSNWPVDIVREFEALPSVEIAANYEE